jgi:hypothetical protein
MLSGSDLERTHSLVDMDSPDTSTVDTGVSADVASPSGFRRRLVGAGLIGLAGSLVPGLAARAGASPDQTTTTAPPKRPSDADLELLRFAQAAELAAEALFDTALTSELGATGTAVISAVRDAHQAFAQALAAEIGRTAPGAPDATIVEASTAAFSGNQSSIMAAAFDLENVLVATHTDIIGQLTGVDGARLISSIIIAESRHAVTFGELAGRTDLAELLDNAATALTPAEG